MKNLLVIASLAILLSCTKEDREEDTTLYFSFNGSKIDIDQYAYNGTEVFGYPYLMDGDTIGFVKTGSDHDSGGKDQFEFFLTDEYPVGAFTVDQHTGCVRVKDGLSLDLKDREFVKFTILVQNKGLSLTLSRGFIVNPLSADVVLSFYPHLYQKDLRGLIIEKGQVLDTLLTSPRFGNGQYSLKQVIPSGAVEIDNESGTIKVLDHSLFNPLLYDKISAIADLKVVHKESNRTWEKEARINFFLTNFNSELCGSSSKSYLYEIDYSVSPEKVIPKTTINKNDFTIREDIQITEEEYTFIPTKDLQLCNAMMYLGTNRSTRYSNLTLVSDQNVVLAQSTLERIDDGWGYIAESMAPLNYVLRANEKYTLRREITNVDKSTSYLSNTDHSDLHFPIQYEDISIVGAKFFDGANELDVSGIPMINLSFVK